MPRLNRQHPYHLYPVGEGEGGLEAQVQVGFSAQALWSENIRLIGFPKRNDKMVVPSERCVVVLVRHGESMWNVIGRIQGSSDFVVLGEPGRDVSAVAAMSWNVVWRRFPKVQVRSRGSCWRLRSWH